MHGSRLKLRTPSVGRSADKHILDLFDCVCGGAVVAMRSRVKAGLTLSCGCLAREINNNKSVHGMRHSPEYKSWGAMKTRCHNPRSKNYTRYGAKGITVCDEWRNSFEAFYAHVGPRPPHTTIDRIDGTKGYEPGNVRWATLIEQARNRKSFTVVSTPEGEMPLVDYAKKLGISKGAAHLRLKRGKLEGVSYV